MRRRVLITEDIHESGKRLLADRGYELRMGSGIAEDVVMREIADCDAVLTRNASITEAVMRAAPSLKVVAMHGVGVDRIDIPAATERGIYVVNAAGSNSVSVADFTIGLMLGLMRHIPLYDRELRAGNSAIRSTAGFDPEGKTLGVVGMGNIGSLVAEKARLAFGMRVVGYRRRVSARTEGGVEWTSNLEHVIREADVLSLHVPFAPGTEKMIGGRELAMMKRGAYLINTARGEVLDTEALIRFLKNGHIAGAALDVFDGPYPGRNHPLAKLPNVILTPHTAAFTHESLERMALYAAEGVDEALSGRVPTRAVNEPDEESLAG